MTRSPMASGRRRRGGAGSPAPGCRFAGSRRGDDGHSGDFRSGQDHAAQPAVRIRPPARRPRRRACCPRRTAGSPSSGCRRTTACGRSGRCGSSFAGDGWKKVQGPRSKVQSRRDPIAEPSSSDLGPWTLDLGPIPVRRRVADGFRSVGPCRQSRPNSSRTARGTGWRSCGHWPAGRPCLIMDEPMAHVDPARINDYWKVIRDHCRDDRDVVDRRHAFAGGRHFRGRARDLSSRRTGRLQRSDGRVVSLAPFAGRGGPAGAGQLVFARRGRAIGWAITLDARSLLSARADRDHGAPRRGLSSSKRRGLPGPSAKWPSRTGGRPNRGGSIIGPRARGLKKGSRVALRVMAVCCCCAFSRRPAWSASSRSSKCARSITGRCRPRER